MYKIDTVSITGVWGIQTFDLKLNSDITIFIGQNGTGKTTLMNLLQAALSVDVFLFSTLDFDEITIHLKKGRSQRKLKIRRIYSESMYDFAEYQISSGKKRRIPLVLNDPDYRGRVHPKHRRNMGLLCEQLAEIVDISWLSVYRDNIEDNENYHRRKAVFLNPVDQRLENLVIKLKNYQLRLESEANTFASEFQASVLLSLLYDQKFDTFDLFRDTDNDFDSLKDELIEAYKLLGVLDSKAKKSINKHIEQIKSAITTCREKSDNGENYNVNEVLPISLYKRTLHIARESSDNISKKNNLFKLINLYEGILGSFFKDKQISLDSQEREGFKILKDNRPIKLRDLSSGEKQLFIILTEALLQEKANTVFFADEPELSLHIEWQQLLLSSIGSLNPNAQIIVATHSPEIAGSSPASIIRMSEVLK